jgi:P27 family predicted phage terminase small subunit
VKKLESTPPPQLSPAAKAHWRRLIRDFAGRDILRSTDRGALTVYCDLWAVYEDAMATVREFGTTAQGRSPDKTRAPEVVSPAWRVARDAKREMDSLWRRFGLTPVDRARLEGRSLEGPTDPLDAMLRARRAGYRPNAKRRDAP